MRKTVADELAYVLVNPYTIFKSRTGGVLSRLFTRTALDLVAARMFTPSSELALEFAKNLSISVATEHERQVRELIRNYVLQNYVPNPKTKLRRRVLMLVFRGDDAVAKVQRAAGPITHPDRVGETIRDTYGDYIQDANGKAVYFEPAILVGQTREDTERDLKLWSSYADADGGLVEGSIAHPPTSAVERTLVLLKPDNFRFPSARPGAILDMFSHAGLYIVALKVHRMSVAQAEAFYGPVREVLRDKMRASAADRAAQALEREFGFTIPPEVKTSLGSTLGIHVADENFNSIIKFMTGVHPNECQPGNKEACGLEKIVAVVYEGENAVKKIRKILGPTDPSKAPPGSVRIEFGQSIMVNAAHASDSAENAQREMGIVKVGENNLTPLVDEFYRGKN